MCDIRLKKDPPPRDEEGGLLLINRNRLLLGPSYYGISVPALVA